jgi:isopenicillin N synthase-like dioxygenase
MIDVDASHAAVRLGQSLFPLFALALDLPENFFDDKVRVNTYYDE